MIRHHVDGITSGRLGCIHQQGYFSDDGFDCVKILNRATDIGAMVDNHQGRFFIEGFTQRIHVQIPFVVTGNHGQGYQAGRFQIFQWPHDRVVFHGGGDDVVALVQKPVDNGVEGFRYVQGKYNSR